MFVIYGDIFIRSFKTMEKKIFWWPAVYKCIISLSNLCNKICPWVMAVTALLLSYYNNRYFGTKIFLYLNLNPSPFHYHVCIHLTSAQILGKNKMRGRYLPISHRGAICQASTPARYKVGRYPQSAEKVPLPVAWERQNLDRGYKEQ